MKKAICSRRERNANLGSRLVDLVEDGLEGALAETALVPGAFIVFVPRPKPLRTEVKSVAERLMDALEAVTACHEHLWFGQRRYQCDESPWISMTQEHTLSKAVEQARG